jgi:hypothetical protein
LAQTAPIAAPRQENRGGFADPARLKAAKYPLREKNICCYRKNKMRFIP